VILWHLGTAAALTYVSLGRRRIDYRYILVGAIAPDVVDAVLGLRYEWGPAGRGIAHSLLAASVVAIAIVVGARGEQRLALFGVAVGWLLHLVADGMWQAPATFLWPAFGPDLSPSPAEPYSLDVLVHPLDHVTTWLGEVAGALLLGWFWVAFDLGRDGRARDFARDGRLRP
jgi:hypothetical protein